MKTRLRFITKHPVQTKYLLTVIVAMIAPTLIIGLCFYKLVFHLLARQIVFPEAILANLVPVIDKINMILVVTLPILGVVILWFAIAISHRFAGPIERLERELDILLEGHWEHKIYTRKNDDLRGIVTRINAIVSKLRK